jgi:hypothetical protein
MDTRRAIVVVESMVGMEGYMRIFTLKMDRWFNGDYGFWSMCMRCSLMVY